MTAETEQTVTDALQQMQQVMSAIDDEKYRASSESFTATDESGTVTVVVNGDRWLTDLRIEQGLLRLGVETVQQRILEALYQAQAAAFAVANDEQQRIEDSLAGFVNSLEHQLGDLMPPHKY